MRSCQISGKSWPLTALASEFQHLIDCAPTVANSTYDGVPLANLSGTSRGQILANLARRLDSDLHPSARIRDPIVGFCSMNKQRRGSGQAEYDWLRDDHRIECKSAKLTWDRSQSTWRLQFSNVKFGLFDELLLVIFTPLEVYIYRHDLKFGFRRQGKNTSVSGHRVVVSGTCRILDWALALQAMLKKLDAGTNGCERLECVQMHDPRIVSALATHIKRQATRLHLDAFASVPLAQVAASSRGNCLEHIAREIDQLLHPNARIETHFMEDGVASVSRI